MSQDELTPTPETQPAAPAAPTRALYRARVAYERREALRYVSHLEMQLVWERTFRRASVPLAFSQGFNPRPRMHMASALPLGFLSRAELIDFWMDLPAEAPAPQADELAARIQAAAPPGLELTGLTFVDLREPALQTQVQAAEYVAHPLDAVDEAALAEAVRALLAAESLPRERRKKPYDLRPLVEALQVTGGPDGPQAGLAMRLTARESATGRPEEVLDALGFEASDWRVERVRLILSQ